MKKKLFLMKDPAAEDLHWICGKRLPRKHWICFDTETGKIVDDEGDSIRDFDREVARAVFVVERGTKWFDMAYEMKMKAYRNLGEKIGVIEYCCRWNGQVDQDEVYKVPVGYGTYPECAFVSFSSNGCSYKMSMYFDEIISDYEKHFNDVDYREGV